MKKRLLVLCPNATDATSFWRGVGPFAQLRSSEWEITFWEGDKNVRWSSVAPFDVLFCQRFNDENCLQVIQNAKTFGKKIWLDYDDDLFNVPLSNKAFQYYGQEHQKKVLAQVMSLADVITVSTEYLKKQLETRVPKVQIEVVPNAWNDYLLPFSGAAKFEKKEAFIWRGGPSHDEDLEAYEDDIRRIKVKYPKYKWLFIGSPLYKVVNWLGHDSCIHIPLQGLAQYYSILRNIKATTCLVPLVNSGFNQSKSNIAWQEATYAGCSTVGPKWEPEWPDPIAKYVPGMNGFSSTVDRAIENAEHYWKSSVDLIQQEYLLSKVNKKRMDILCAL